MAFESRHRKPQDKKPPKSKWKKTWNRKKDIEFEMDFLKDDIAFLIKLKKVFCGTFSVLINCIKVINSLRKKAGNLTESDIKAIVNSIEKIYLSLLNFFLSLDIPNEEKVKYLNELNSNFKNPFKPIVDSNNEGEYCLLKLMEMSNDLHEKHDNRLQELSDKKEVLNNELIEINNVIESRHEKWAVDKAYEFFLKENQDVHITKRTFQNWIAGINPPKGFPGIENYRDFVIWCHEGYKGKKPKIIPFNDNMSTR